MGFITMDYRDYKLNKKIVLHIIKLYVPTLKNGFKPTQITSNKTQIVTRTPS